MMGTTYGEIGCDGRDSVYDDDDDDGWDWMGGFFDHVFMPVLIGASMLVMVLVASSAVWAILYLWTAILALLGQV
jgi:hypothetical protein